MATPVFGVAVRAGTLSYVPTYACVLPVSAPYTYSNACRPASSTSTLLVKKKRARCLYVRVHARSYVRACIMPTVDDTPTCCVVRTGHTGNISEMCMHTWCPAKCDEPPACMPIRMRWVCTHHVVYVARAALRTYLDSIVIHACMISWTGLSICLAVVWICVTLRHGKTGRALATEIRICMHATGRP
jgi:hypothetical protein